MFAQPEPIASKKLRGVRVRIATECSAVGGSRYNLRFVAIGMECSTISILAHDLTHSGKISVMDLPIDR